MRMTLTRSYPAASRPTVGVRSALVTPALKVASLICSVCGIENPSGKRFCGDCGAALESACPNCGASNPPGKRFCGDCGYALTSAGSGAATTPTPARPTAGVAAPGAGSPVDTGPVAERRLV